MKYPVIYIKGKGSHTARFSEMVEGRMYVVGDIGSAMRTLTSLRTDHAFILYEQRDPAADLSDIRLLNSWPGGGIVLITSRELTERERREYLRAGVNSATSSRHSSAISSFLALRFQKPLEMGESPSFGRESFSEKIHWEKRASMLFGAVESSSIEAAAPMRK